jgi:FkbM family methyltransferase
MIEQKRAFNELLLLRRKAGLLAGNALKASGWEVRRVTRNPEHSLLGLRKLDIRTILDVGANTGQFAKTYRRLFPAARVVSFEPIPSAFLELSSWAASEPRVTALNVALGESEGSVDMIEHTQNTVSSSLLSTTETSVNIWPAQARQRMVPVAVTTLDKAVAGQALEPKVLVKLDVQGYEDRVIRGASETLRHTAAAIVEVNLDNLYEGQARFKDIVNGLDAAGLRYAGALEQTIHSDGHVIFFDALFLRP